MDNSIIQLLLDRYLSGACSEKEQRQVEEWLHRMDNPGNEWASMNARDRAAWMAALYRDIQHTMGLDSAPERLPAAVIPMYKRLSFRIAGVAAIILMLGAGAYLWIQHQARLDLARTESRSGSLTNDALPGRNGAILTLADKRQVVLDSLGDGVVTTQGKTTVLIKNGQLVYAAAGPDGAMLNNTMTTPRGRQYRLTLPDGSGVWLNAASSITYPTAFSATERSVAITGEAYFEVAKDRARPFRVKVNEMQVDVLGTNFNINAYPGQGSIRITLLKGSVKVKSVQAAVTLQPGQQASLAASPSTPLLQVRSDADIDEVMAWKNGFFKFNDTDIRTVMQQLERWYDLEVVYEGAVPKDHFGGKLPRDANASEVLKALEQTQVHFRIEGKKLIVMP
jgi:ferric-dicitrate binding protein FerR (iron transport regulator)